jgi:hypothetical protein
MKLFYSVCRSVAYSIPLAILIVGGCGFGQSGYTADGLITVSGKSASFAELTLWSTSDSPAIPVAMARTDEQGRFEFTSAAKLKAGEYAVTCKKFELPSGADLKSDEKPTIKSQASLLSRFEFPQKELPSIFPKRSPLAVDSCGPWLIFYFLSVRRSDPCSLVPVV